MSPITAENNFSSAERQISAKAGRSGLTKRLRWLRLIKASSRWRSAALVNLQALEAYVSLDIITDRYMVCNDESSIQCARNTLKAYRACAQQLMMRCVCSATDRLLVKVTPIILITVTRLILGSGGEGCISSFLLLLLSTKATWAFLFRLAVRLLVPAHSWICNSTKLWTNLLKFQYLSNTAFIPNKLIPTSDRAILFLLPH